MAKRSKVSINSIDKIIASFDTTDHEINYGDIAVKIKPSIKLSDYAEMIKDIVLMVFDTKTGKFNYEFSSFAVKYQIVKRFTNFSTDNVGRIFDLVNNTDIMDRLAKIIQPNIATITKDANDAIDFIKQTVYKSSPWDEVADMVKEYLGKLNKSSEALGEVNNEDLNKVIQIFGNITQDDIKNLVFKKMREDGQS